MTNIWSLLLGDKGPFGASLKCLVVGYLDFLTPCRRLVELSRLVVKRDKKKIGLFVSERPNGQFVDSAVSISSIVEML